jgi:hydrogenase nickel incorporation protein HypA/HybF
MHELSLVLNMIEICEEQGRLKGFERIEKIVIEAGELSGVSVPSLRFSFDSARKGTIAEWAVLEVMEPPGTGWCESCSRTVLLNDPFRECPDCGQGGITPTGGMDFRIRELTVR